jgi:hypothetical protein
MLTLSACALHTTSPPADRAVPSTVRGSQLQGTVVEIATQKTLSFEAFVKTVAQAQVVAVGEEHYHPDIQAFELRLLQALAQHRPQRVALAMEFLERDMQSADITDPNRGDPGLHRILLPLHTVRSPGRCAPIGAERAAVPGTSCHQRRAPGGHGELTPP